MIIINCNTLLEIVGRDNLNVIFYEKLLISKEEYFSEISSLLSLSNSETSKLLNGKSIHNMKNQINTDSELSTISQLIFHQIKNINLKKIFNKNFMPRLFTFIKKKIYPNIQIDKEKILENRSILNSALMKFEENNNKIKHFFAKSNKNFFKKIKQTQK